MLKHCAANRKRRLSALPYVSPYIYDIKISGFTRSSICIYKGKAIPLQALTDPEGSRRLRLPDFKTIGT
jgi:hypothetical protein